MGAGFAYDAPTVELDILGEAVTLRVGDVDTIRSVDDACRTIASLGEDASWGELSERLRGFIRTVMGDDAFDRAFGGRPANVIEEIECLAYIRRRIRESLADGDALASAVRRLMEVG